LHPLATLLLVATCAAIVAACNGSDACGCLCDGPPDGSILAPCTPGFVDLSDATMAADPDAGTE